ncbi:RecA regulator RecX [Reinekea sp. MED297]|uniref:Regulatory protein RecX n=1 Tax=Reinekea blandensis MED297 TaxID=314283 RepID=A4BCJ1_9GAMM|nr:RecA regulator RecX [Reinekea sp. MED297] [Reinekea blandensis MED297]
MARKFPEESDQIEAVIARLQEQGLQSDERFTEMWVRSQLMKGRGPIRIVNEARQRGIAERVEQALGSLDHDWFEAALDVAKRKFPNGVSFEQQAKVYRFLSYRGYSSDCIRYVCDTLKQSASD